MFRRQVLGSVVILTWLVLIFFLWGPMRWEFAHTYEISIKDIADSLPAPTVIFALPVLGLGNSDLISWGITAGFWGIAWLGPVVLFIGIWRARHREQLVDWMLFGGFLYGVFILFLGAWFVFSLWLPFGYL